eukprot:297892-Prymnesium_polylepis.2
MRRVREGRAWSALSSRSIWRACSMSPSILRRQARSRAVFVAYVVSRNDSANGRSEYTIAT